VTKQSADAEKIITTEPPASPSTNQTTPSNLSVSVPLNTSVIIPESEIVQVPLNTYAQDIVVCSACPHSLYHPRNKCI